MNGLSEYKYYHAKKPLGYKKLYNYRNNIILAKPVSYVGMCANFYSVLIRVPKYTPIYNIDIFFTIINL